MRQLNWPWWQSGLSSHVSNSSSDRRLSPRMESCSGQFYKLIPNTLELQIRVAPSVEYVTTKIVPTPEAIPEEGG